MIKDLKGKWAIVTGASKGIGREYSRLLAAQRVNILLIARSENLLNELSKELIENHGVKCFVFAIDMTEADFMNKLDGFLTDKNLYIDIVINNAGFGVYDEFVESDLSRTLDMMNLNMNAQVEMTYYFLKKMKEKNEGMIQLVASIASYFPTPLYSVYGATKSFLRHFGISVNYELRNTNIHMSVLNPGVTDTDFFQAAKQKLSLSQKVTKMSPRSVAEYGLGQLLRNNSTCLPGIWNQLTAYIFSRIMPEKIKAAIIYNDIKNLKS